MKNCRPALVQIYFLHVSMVFGRFGHNSSGNAGSITFVRRWSFEMNSGSAGSPSIDYNSSIAIKQRQDIFNSVCEEYLDVLNPERVIMTQHHHNSSIGSKSKFCIPSLFDDRLQAEISHQLKKIFSEKDNARDHHRILIVSHPLQKLIRMSQVDEKKFIENVQTMISHDDDDLIGEMRHNFNAWEVCPLCVGKDLRPNIILKLEHINEDVKYLSRLFKPNSVGENNDDGAALHIKSEQINVLGFVELLNEFQKGELFNILRSHYELFGYDPFQDLLSSSKDLNIKYVLF